MVVRRKVTRIIFFFAKNMNDKINIVWFKKDLRLYDHAPLCEAARLGKVIPIYIVEPDLWRQPDSSQRHWHFLHDSLSELNSQINELGGRLLVRVGGVVPILENLKKQFSNLTLWSHEETGNAWTFKRDLMVAEWCRKNEVYWHEYPSHGVIRRLKSRDDWSKVRGARMAEKILDKPQSIQFVENVSGDKLPCKEDPIFNGPILTQTQVGGRKHGIMALNSFLQDRGRKYLITLSKPGVSARHCSRLSAHITYGTLSVREIEQATKTKILNLCLSTDEEAKQLIRNLSAFLSRLAWRCHFVQKLEQQPDIETHCMHSAFEGMREPYFRDDYFSAWKTGNTGYPLIDASMRSLIENGWITFRMRAMLVSFASYHLWLDWRKTAPYLAQLFTDYEPGIHYSQFQMQSGVTGINAIRIYNPIKQSLEHDPYGKFIRRYLPELQDVPDIFIHEPWRWSDTFKNYPRPIVDHNIAVKNARFQLAQCWKKSDFNDQAKEVHRKLGSRDRSSRRQTKSKKDLRQMELFLD